MATQIKAKKISSKQILRAIIDFSRPRLGKLIAGAILAAAVILVSDFLGPMALAQILEKLQSPKIHIDQFWALIGLFAASQLFAIFGWRMNMNLVGEGQGTIRRDGYVRIFGRLTNHSLNFHANKFSGALVNQTSKFLGAIETFWDTVIFSVVSLVISLLSAIIILWFQFWQYALILLATAILYTLATIFFSCNMAKNNIEEARKTSKISGQLSDDLTNIMTVKAYSAEKRELRLARINASSWYQTFMNVLRDMRRLMTVSGIISNSIRIVVIVVAVMARQHNLISIGAVLLMVSYTNTLTMRLHEVRHIIRSYNRIVGDAAEMTEILNTPIEVKDKSDNKLQVKKGVIEFKNITFSHQKNNTLFRGFDLYIPAGQKVGLVGYSGSGKSSLASLLMRFYDIESGQILIDGQDIAKVSQASLRQAIAYVPQEPLMFHRSVSENIAFGKPKAKPAEIKTAAIQACADEFIDKLPQKYETLVGERGVKLSGGQRQRIAIARAIIKGAPILVLDEATSALDSESERYIQDAMDELMIGRTSLVVAHRLSTIAKLDRIIVLDDGKVVEDGSHQELLDKNGQYAKLWRRQSGGFIHEEQVK